MYCVKESFPDAELPGISPREFKIVFKSIQICVKFIMKSAYNKSKNAEIAVIAITNPR